MAEVAHEVEAQVVFATFPVPLFLTGTDQSWSLSG